MHSPHAYHNLCAHASSKLECLEDVFTAKQECIQFTETAGNVVDVNRVGTERPDREVCIE